MGGVSHLSMFVSVCCQCLLFCFVREDVGNTAECWWVTDGVNGTVSSVSYIAKCDIFSGLRLSLS